MKTNEKKNTSAKKKLIPAVAMLTTSAVMLSTATYAWFTMNKDATVTGLQLTATTSNSLELSLGEIDASGKPTNTAPTIQNKSWTSNVAISQYYKTVGKLKPASSNTGLNLFKVKEEKNIYAGGANVKSDADVVALTYADSANLTFQDAWTESAGDYSVSELDTDAGYFIDVPMWIRTNTTDKDTKVACTVTISDPNVDNGSELLKAVRVAIIPVGTAESKVGGDDGINTTLTLTGSNAMRSATATSTSPVSLEAVSTQSFYALNGETYNAADSKQKALSKAETGNYASALGDVVTFVPMINGNTDTTSVDKTSNNVVFTLKKASKDSYSGESFIARVWIEGESKYCSDATASQDWNINFNFRVADET